MLAEVSPDPPGQAHPGRFRDRYPSLSCAGLRIPVLSFTLAEPCAAVRGKGRQTRIIKQLY